MLERVAHHYVGIKRGSERKYRILAEVQRKGHPIEFDVLYYAESNRKRDILNEIGKKEGGVYQSVPPDPEYPNSKRRGLAQMGSQCGGRTNSVEVVSG